MEHRLPTVPKGYFILPGTVLFFYYYFFAVAFCHFVSNAAKWDTSVRKGANIFSVIARQGAHLRLQAGEQSTVLACCDRRPKENKQTLRTWLAKTGRSTASQNEKDCGDMKCH